MAGFKTDSLACLFKLRRCGVGLAPVAQEETKILALLTDHRQRVSQMGAASLSTLRVQEFLQRRPVTSVSAAAAQLQLSEPTVLSSLRRLSAAGLVTEATGRRPGQVFVYAPLHQAAWGGH